MTKFAESLLKRKEETSF